MTAPLRAPTSPTVPVAAAPRESYLLLLAHVFRPLCGDAEGTGSRVVGCPRCGRRNRVPAAGEGVPVCGNCRHALPWIADARDEDFADVAEQSSLPVLVELWAPWCGLSCLARPVLEGLTLMRPGELKLVEVEVTDAPEETRRLEVRSVPTLLMLRRGEIMARRYGVAPAPELRDWLDGTLAALSNDTAARTGTVNGP